MNKTRRRLLAAVRAAAMMWLVALGVTPVPASASDVATSVTFTVLNTCSSNQPIGFKVGSTTVGTVSGGSDCTCTPPLRTYTTTDPTVLALYGTTCVDAPATSSVVWNGSGYLAWARVDITRSESGTEGLCFVDTSGGNCNVANLCSAGYTGYGAQTFSKTSVLPDTDGDALNDCVDPDIDNDGILNATDNCPSTANVTQIDTDGNGKGDACDPYDLDGDGVWNINDNCPVVSNADQTDTDGNGAGDACQPDVVAVPWLGSEALAHQVYSGGSIVLQAVATLHGSEGTPVTLTSATWDPGDGTGAVSVPVTNSRAIELAHTYTGSAGQPFTATVTIVDLGGHTYSDTFKVVIAANTRETRVNMAIDKALWNLHKRLVFSTTDGKASGYWQNTGSANNGVITVISATASAVQAFEINNHRESGDPLRDPYVFDVKRGLRLIMGSALSGGQLVMRGVTVSPQGANDPDSNGNGFGLVVSPSDHSSYLGGQVVDAIVASGTPNAIADVGQATYVNGRAYKDIVQDMLDGYSWGMNDSVGGWHYTYNAGSNDTSASHWWAIAVLAGQVWGLDAPAWVKNIQWTVGVPLMQAPVGYDSQGCYFGYTGSYGNWWGDNQTNVTAAGLILMNADGIPQTNARFTCAMQWLDTKFNAASSFGNYYTMYQTAKAMRTAIDGSSATSPITLLNGTRDWYAAYADYLISVQDGAGAFQSTQGSIGPYIKDDLATAWGVIILSPSLFELPPTAACTVNPATIGKNGGTVNFDASASFHPDSTATITGYSWNFDDGSPAGSGVTTSHTYAAPASFPTTRSATVTVTDSNGNAATASCPVTIVNDNVPPAVAAGGPYTMCVGAPLTLTGTATDEDGTIASSGWDLNSPINFATIDAAGNSIDATAVFTAKGPGTYDIGFQAVDDNGATTGAFTTVTVLAATNPVCNQPPVAVDDAASTPSGTPVTITVLANDSDPDAGQTLTVTGVGAAANGSVTTDGTTATYTPALGFAGVDTFTYTISDGHGGTATATVTVTVAKRSATVTAGSGTKVYGDADPAMPPTSTGFLAEDGITLDQTRDAGDDVGSYATHATASGATLANYDVTYQDGTLTITPAPSTTVVTCPASVVYSGSAQEVCTATVTGAGGLNQAVTPVTYANNVNVGTADASATYAGDANHDGSSGSSTFAITKAAATVTAANSGKSYGAADPALVATSTGFLPADGISVNATRAAGEPVGTYPIAAGASGAALGNYEVTYVNATFTISAAPLIVRANDAVGSHGNPLPPLSVSYAGFVNGEDPSVLGGTLLLSTLATPASPAGVYAIVPSGLTSANYDITFVPGTLTLTNEAPVAVNDAYTTQWNTVLPVAGPGVLGNDSDPNHDPLTAVKVTDPTHGTVTLNANGSFSYKPTANYSGVDSFTYLANDGALDSNVATVTITITSPCRLEDDGDDDHDDEDDDGEDHHAGDGDDHDRGKNGHHDGDGCEHDRAAHRHDRDDSDKFEWEGCKPGTPNSHSDRYHTLKNKTLTVKAKGVLKNDGRFAAVAELYTEPSHGTVTLAANGGLVYTPAVDFVGTDVFYYVPRSATGVAGAVTSVTIRVSKHHEGDGDDHDRKRKGHRDGDGCEHDRDRRGSDGNDKANDNYREGDGDGHRDR